jgi:glycosyltransferase involved in cell wall biosynthesis
MASAAVSVAALIWFPSVSGTIDTTPEEKVVTVWALRQIRSVAAPAALRIVVQSGYESPVVRALPDDLAALLFRTAKPAQLAALIEAITAAEADTAVLVDLGAAALGGPVLARLIKRHLDQRNWLTLAEGFPEGVAPLLANRKLLALAASIPGSSGHVPLVPFLERCADIARQTDFPDATKECIRREEVEDECVASQELPHGFTFDGPHSCRALLRLINDKPAMDRRQLLREWRKVEQRQAAEWRPWRRPMAGTKPRVLMVSNPSAYSGAEEALYNSARSIHGHGIKLHLLVGLEGHFARKMRTAGCEVSIAGHDFSAFAGRNTRMLSRILEHVDPHVIHINSPSGPMVEWLGRLRGAKILYHLRLADAKGLGPTLRHADRVIAVSEYVKRLAIEAGAEPDHVTLLYDAIDEGRFRPPAANEYAAARDRFGISQGRTAIVMVARFARNKRHDLLIDAIARLPRGTVQALLVGESVDGEDWESEARVRVERLGLTGEVGFPGFQPDIEEVHRAADISVLCSEMEPLGMAVLEAMAMAKPVVICRGSGLTEIVDGNCGAVVEPSPDALARELLRLSSDPDLRIECGKAAREKVLRACSSDVHGQALSELYFSLAGD